MNVYPYALHSKNITIVPYNCSQESSFSEENVEHDNRPSYYEYRYWHDNDKIFYSKCCNY